MALKTPQAKAAYENNSIQDIIGGPEHSGRNDGDIFQTEILLTDYQPEQFYQKKEE